MRALAAAAAPNPVVCSRRRRVTCADPCDIGTSHAALAGRLTLTGRPFYIAVGAPGADFLLPA